MIFGCIERHTFISRTHATLECPRCGKKSIDIKRIMEIGDKVKVVKMSDDKFGGKHPNGIESGYVVYGTIVNPVEVGSFLYLNKASGDAYGYFHTSEITKIIDENHFKTRNSTYKITKFES